MVNDELRVPTNPNAGKTELSDIDNGLGIQLINADIRKKEIDKDILKEERGFLGRFFGGKDSSSNNIAGFFICILLFIVSCYTAGMAIYCPNNTHSQILDIWNVVTPLITLALGYIFGNKLKD